MSGKEYAKVQSAEPEIQHSRHIISTTQVVNMRKRSQAQYGPVKGLKNKKVYSDGMSSGAEDSRRRQWPRIFAN